MRSSAFARSQDQCGTHPTRKVTSERLLLLLLLLVHRACRGLVRAHTIIKAAHGTAVVAVGGAVR